MRSLILSFAIILLGPGGPAQAADGSAASDLKPAYVERKTVRWAVDENGMGFQRIYGEQIAAAGVDEPRPPIISGEWRYPTPYVLAALALDQFISIQHRQIFQLEFDRGLALRDSYSTDRDDFQVVNLPQNILSIGEGTSGLVPYLRSQGVDAYAVDLWYGEDLARPYGDTANFAELVRYVELHRPYLIDGNGTDLCNVRPLSPESVKGFYDCIPDNHFELVVSHRVLPVVNGETRRGIIAEAFRVLKPGGTFRATLWFVGKISRTPPDANEVAYLLSDLSDNYDYVVLQGTTSLTVRTGQEVTYFDSLPFEEVDQMPIMRAYANQTIFGPGNQYSIYSGTEQILLLRKNDE